MTCFRTTIARYLRKNAAIQGYHFAATPIAVTTGIDEGETPCSFQRASEEKLRSRRIVSVADRFRRSAAATRPTPGGDGSRSTSTDAPPSPSRTA